MEIQKKVPLSGWRLFGIMFKLGALTFGGGWSIIAQMQQELVERYGWLTSEELVDLALVGRSLPGIMVINTATLVGYHLKGIRGACLAIIGTSLPSMIIICVITFFYQKFRDNIYVAKALNGVRAVVLPIILSAAVTMKETALKNKLSYAIAAGALLICLFVPISNMWVVIGGAVIGLLWMGGKEDAVS
jgi:chromate transporter